LELSKKVAIEVENVLDIAKEGRSLIQCQLVVFFYVSPVVEITLEKTKTKEKYITSQILIFLMD
jgi:hypothetical protein